MGLVTGVESYIFSGWLIYYYLLVLIGLFYVLFKIKPQKLNIFLVLLFWEGLIVYVDYQYISYAREAYRIGLILFSILLFGGSVFKNSSNSVYFINVIFGLFTLSFWITYQINDTSLLTTASQYGLKYLLPFLIFHQFLNNRFSDELIVHHIDTIRVVLIIQILLSVAKVIILGFGESIVGSISFIGGGPAATIPVIGILFIWVTSFGLIKKKDWLLILGMLVIVLVSNKRAPVIIIPFILLYLYVYVNRTKNLLSFIKYIPIVVLVFYIGVRTNPTLNPQGSRWGSFNLQFTYQYIIDYTFGSEERRKEDLTYGKGGTLLMFLSKSTLEMPLDELLFGTGIDKVLKSYDDFDHEAYGVSSRGAISGAVSKFITLGILGFILNVLFGLSLINTIKFYRLRNLLIGYFLFDYMLYNGTLIEHGATLFLFLFVIRFSGIIPKLNSNHTITAPITQ